MTNSYLSQEVAKITAAYPYPLNIAMSSAWIIGNFKGINLKIMDMRRESILADYFVLGSANNATLAKAIADAISHQLRPLVQRSVAVEGMETGDWILLDFGDVMVHIFQDAVREIFDLDSLWGRAPLVEIPAEYYFQSGHSDDSPSDSDPFSGQGHF